MRKVYIIKFRAAFFILYLLTFPATINLKKIKNKKRFFFLVFWNHVGPTRQKKNAGINRRQFIYTP